jgi:hypothetical protein
LIPLSMESCRILITSIRYLPNLDNSLTVKNGSVITWQHINLQGEYDFSEENLKNPIEFELPELLDLQVL